MGGNNSKAADPDAGNRYSTPVPVKDEDYSKPLPREKLPQELQKIVDNEESLWDKVYEGQANESTDSNVRYAAYATRIRTILVSAHRYVAYTSDIGESFRPIAHPYLVKGAYGISWAYLVGDVSHEAYKAYSRQQKLLNPVPMAGAPVRGATNASIGEGNVRGRVPAIEDWRTVAVQRAIFQSLASMGLPAFTIHSIVRYSGRALKDAKNTRIRTYGPIGLGLAAVPFLPFIFDKPVEDAVEWSFHKAFETIGGPDAIGKSPSTGREHLLAASSNKIKEKEL